MADQKGKLTRLTERIAIAKGKVEIIAQGTCRRKAAHISSVHFGHPPPPLRLSFPRRINLPRVLMTLCLLLCCVFLFFSCLSVRSFLCLFNCFAPVLTAFEIRAKKIDIM